MNLTFNYELKPLVKAFKVRKCFDIEANGLLKEVSLFFCGVVINVDNDTREYFAPQDAEAFLKSLDAADWLIGHNIIGYDIPALFKLYGWAPKNHQVIYDTLVASRMYNPNLGMHPDCPKKIWSEHAQAYKNVGPHTLMNLGYIVGVHKDSFGEEKAFDAYCPEMLDYCEQDVVVNVAIFKWLEEKLKPWSDISIQCEMDIATYINAQIRSGWFFNIEGAENLRVELEEEVKNLEDVVRETFKPLYKPKAFVKDHDGHLVPKEVQPRVKGDGTLSSVSIKNIYGAEYSYIIPPPSHRIFGDRVEYYSGAFTPVVTEEFNLSSRQQIAERMQRAGWKPTKFTDKGNVIINDDILEQIGDTGIPEGVLLQRYFLITKRLAMLQGWIKAYDWDTKSIHGYVNSVGAVTSRMTHSNPNVAQTPAASTTDVHGYVRENGEVVIVNKAKKNNLCLMTFNGSKFKQGDLVEVDKDTLKPVKLVYTAKDLRSGSWDEFKCALACEAEEILLWGEAGDWGADCRNLFTVPEGRLLVGCDASGLELRCLAHYMNDAEYTDLILHGDIHTHNQHLAGLPERRLAKTFIYAFLYGAGDAKIGSIVGGKSKEGKALKAKFLKGLPKLKILLDKITHTVESRGMRGTASLKGLDKRIVRVRSPHAALNTLLQSCGAIVMKYWLICVMQEVKARGLDVQACGNIHK